MMRICRLFSTAKELKSEKFMALIKPPQGIKQELSQEERRRINDQITVKMQELQETGLSRDQIILSKSQKGLPLKVDPFFQFLKQNYRAREIYLKNNDRFSVQNVIDVALRQDIGADPSMSRIRGPDQIDTTGRAELMNQIRDLGQHKFNPQSYDGPNSFSVQRAYDELKPHQPLRHYFKPLDRYEKRQQNLRRLKKYDIHWRNVELLRQFMTINGNIKSRYKNFLSDGDQRSTRLAIKTARIMGALPYFGRTPDPLKRNITSLEDQVQQIGYQHINLQTGHLFQTRSRSQDSLQVQIEEENDLDKKYQRMQSQKSNYKLWINNLQQNTKQSELKSQKYARYIKQEELKTKVDKSQEQNINNILSGISKFKSLKEEEVKLEASNEEECREDYEENKKIMQLEFKEDPEKILIRLLTDKLKL